MKVSSVIFTDFSPLAYYRFIRKPEITFSVRVLGAVIRDFA